MGGDRRDRQEGDQSDQRQDGADGHEPGKADAVEQQQAERTAGGEGAIHAHADQGHHLAGAGRAHQADGPIDHADHGQALTQPQQQPAGDQHGVAGLARQRGQAGQQADQPGRGIDQQALPHRDLAADAVHAHAGRAARQDGREKGDADGETALDIAETKPGDHMDRHGRQGHGDGQIGQEQDPGQGENLTIGGVAGHGFALHSRWAMGALVDVNAYGRETAGKGLDQALGQLDILAERRGEVAVGR